MFNELVEIQTRICELQKSHVSLQDSVKSSQNFFDKELNDITLRLIDILDMIGITKSNDSVDNKSNGQIIINKIEKRIIEILKRLKVQEIIFTNNFVEIGKARVLETREVKEVHNSGTILEICRKGYQRGDKVIRPADVITMK